VHILTIAIETISLSLTPVYVCCLSFNRAHSWSESRGLRDGHGSLIL
jgi:hypothetical protein